MDWVFWTASAAALYRPLAVLADALETPPAGTAAGALALGGARHAAPPLGLVLAR